jgi:hypothetical protein
VNACSQKISPPKFRGACVLIVLWAFSAIAYTEELAEPSAAQSSSPVKEETPSQEEERGTQEEVADTLTQDEQEALEATAEEVDSADEDIMSLDVGGSLIDAVNVEDFLSFGFDGRTAASWSESEDQFGDSDHDDEITARLRLEGNWNPTESLRLTGRVAGICSTESCNAGSSFESGVAGNTIEAGKFTVDELFIHWFRTERFDLALGRLQTKFVTRGGVFAKSLDRNNSNNTSINWTDGLHATVKARGGWVGHLIVERNDEDPGSVRRAPLDFSTDDAEFTRFIAIENTQPWGRIVQRGLDISYLPKSLLKDGDPLGRREDYWGVVARIAARFRLPNAPGDRRMRLAGEIGYAPNTPTQQAMDVGVSGDTDGLAWNVSANLMEFARGHSIGLLYGRTGAGWLLSPQYRANEEQIELRWSWRPNTNLVVDARVRSRKDLDRLLTASQRSDDLDVFVRATWRLNLMTR